MIVMTGYLLDLIWGEFNNPWHPVCLIGKLGQSLKKQTHQLSNQYFAGLIVWLLTFMLTLGSLFLILFMAKQLSESLVVILQIIIVYLCLCTKGLINASKEVADQLKNQDIIGARKYLARIVGRDTEQLNHDDILKATIETLSENLSDGVIAPLFYYALFGIYGMLGYKMINTLDSMFGYRNKKYYAFGFVSAKIDDLANLIPARLTAILLMLSTLLLKLDFKQAILIYKRDRYRHLSPNSAHPQAVVAGALNIQLGGPNYYFKQLVDKPFIGDFGFQVNENMLKQTQYLIYLSATIMVALVILKEVIFI